jgi:iron complex transport system permease protein
VHKAAPYLLLTALLAAVVAAALLLGHGNLHDPALEHTLLELRATRVGAAFLAGAALAVGGVVVQGVFRNPLVSPSILGTTAGAMLGGQLALLLLATLAPGAISVAGVGLEMVLPVGCLAGAALALVIVLAFTRERSGTLMLILTGFILSSLFLA